MEGISENQNCFFIDLLSRQVFCRSCRGLCKHLARDESVSYWCGNHECGNSGEVVLLPDGAWRVYSVVESWFSNGCSAFSSKLLASHEVVRRDVSTEQPA